MGRILRAHGIKGELVVEPLTDRADRLAAGAELRLSRSPEGDEGTVPARVVGSRPHKGRQLVKLDRIDERTHAEQRAGFYLLIPRADAEAARREGEHFEHDLVGARVVTEAGDDLGRVVALLATGAAPLLEIGRPDRPTRYLPFVKDFVRAVEAGAIVVTPPAGWEEL